MAMSIYVALYRLCIYLQEQEDTTHKTSSKIHVFTKRNTKMLHSKMYNIEQEQNLIMELDS